MSNGPSPRRLGAAFLGLLQGHVALLAHELEDQRNQALRALLLGGKRGWRRWLRLALIMAPLLRRRQSSVD